MHLLLNYLFNVFQTTHLGHNKSVKTLFFIFRLYDRVNKRDIQIIIFFKVRDDNIEMSQASIQSERREIEGFESGRSESGRSKS